MIKIKRVIYFFGLFLKLFPRKKVILFRSFHGQYNDNPKYISECIHKLDSNIKLIWAISDEANKEDIPGYVRQIKYNSLKYYYYIYRSKVVVDNYFGIIYSYANKKSILSRLIVKDKKQLNVSTWHGTPLKKIGKNQKEYSDDKNVFYTSCNLMTANSIYLKDRLKDAFNINNIKLYGSPRNDILYSNNSQAIKKKLGLPLNKKLVLFAPTFRDSLYESGERQLKELNIEKLIKLLNEKFGGEFVFIARVHNEVLKKFDFSVIKNIDVINGNLHDDMGEYLSVADVLITDYSGSLFDYALTLKPIFLLTLDKKNYEEVERDFYIKLDQLPFSYAVSINEFYSNIKSFDNQKFINNVKEFNKKLGCMDDGKSALRVSKIILDFINHGDNSYE